MFPEPTALDCKCEAFAVLSRAATVGKQERSLDLLDVDAANGVPWAYGIQSKSTPKVAGAEHKRAETAPASG